MKFLATPLVITRHFVYESELHATLLLSACKNMRYTARACNSVSYTHLTLPTILRV